MYLHSKSGFTMIIKNIVTNLTGMKERNCFQLFLLHTGGWPKKNPVILISFVLPGNIFPVSESHRDNTRSLLGTPIKSGFQSHYVLVKADGTVCPQIMNQYYDELVIDQEAQILPGFLMEIDRSNLGEIAQQFHYVSQRVLAGLLTATE